jgi:hypothetical protein
MQQAADTTAVQTSAATMVLLASLRLLPQHGVHHLTAQAATLIRLPMQTTPLLLVRIVTAATATLSWVVL